MQNIGNDRNYMDVDHEKSMCRGGTMDGVFLAFMTQRNTLATRFARRAYAVAALWMGASKGVSRIWETA